MLLQLFLIIGSVALISAVYGGRLLSKDGKSLMFSTFFLQKADDCIFDFFKFVYKLYSLIVHNVSAFLSTIPHAFVYIVHKISKAVTNRTHVLVEKIKKKNEDI